MKGEVVWSVISGNQEMTEYIEYSSRREMLGNNLLIICVKWEDESYIDVFWYNVLYGI